MDLENVIEKMGETSQDYFMPRRVKMILRNIGEDLKSGDQDLAVRITSAIYRIEEIANEINIPMHAKTALWNIISDLESLKE
jgi:uncharacterized protein (UPF0147 family)